MILTQVILLFIEKMKTIKHERRILYRFTFEQIKTARAVRKYYVNGIIFRQPLAAYS